KAAEPVFEELYRSVKSGNETRIVLEANSAPDYSERLRRELSDMASSEMWRAGAAVRSLRPENQAPAGSARKRKPGASKPSARRPAKARPAQRPPRAARAARKPARKAAASSRRR